MTPLAGTVSERENATRGVELEVDPTPPAYPANPVVEDAVRTRRALLLAFPPAPVPFAFARVELAFVIVAT